MTVGAIWTSDYERYAHAAVARKAGLPEEAIHALAQGSETVELSETEQLAQRLTRQLVVAHQLTDELYMQGVTAFGAKGIADLIFLAGCYVTISSLLNAFKVPTPQ